MNVVPPDELEIIRAQKTGGKALESVLEKTSSYIFSLCLSWCRPPIDPSDVAQDSLIRVAKNIAHFEHKSAFFSWVYTIAYRTFLDALRKEKRRQAIVSTQPIFDEIPGQIDPESLEGLEILIECLDSLDEKHREILILVDAKELSYQVVADELGIPIGTVRSRVARARLQLKKMLQNQGTYSRDNIVSLDEETK